MITVASRRFRSSPHRDALATWRAISDLLVPDATGAARAELDAVAGIAASIIVERTPANAPIIVTCDGPRTRIYCLYDDGALDAASASESALGFDPLAGNWAVSLPCETYDLDWVCEALEKHTSRVVARDASTGIDLDAREGAGTAQAVTLDPKGFLGS